MHDDLKDSELAQDIADEAEKGTDKIIVRAQIVGFLAWFLAPSVGIVAGISTGVGEALNQLVNRRIYQRIRELRDAMYARLSEVDRSKVDKDWFLSEEFQTMLFEAARQVTVTADRQKVVMLGNALANGGISDFSNETRKELFLQLIRDLTPQHVSMLRRLLPHEDANFNPQWRWNARPSIVGNNADELAVLQMLAAQGLVTERIKPPKLREPRFGSNVSVGEAKHIVTEFIKELQQPPGREFRISEFGRDFLQFISLRATSTESVKSVPPAR